MKNIKKRRKKILNQLGSWKRLCPKNQIQCNLDIHKAIGKLPKPKSGFTLPGHKYTGPYRKLDKQLKYEKDTGEVHEIYDKQTRTTDDITMQHDVGYTVCEDDKRCKNRADRKMVKSLDAEKAVEWELTGETRRWITQTEKNTVHPAACYY